MTAQSTQSRACCSLKDDVSFFYGYKCMKYHVSDGSNPLEVFTKATVVFLFAVFNTFALD